MRIQYNENKDKNNKIKPDENGVMMTEKVQCSFRIYHKKQAEKFEQGKGRNEPNNDPHLPEPEKKA